MRPTETSCFKDPLDSMHYFGTVNIFLNGMNFSIPLGSVGNYNHGSTTLKYPCLFFPIVQQLSMIRFQAD